jgi:TatD DNase family protein
MRVPGGPVHIDDATWIDSHCHLQDTYRPEGLDLLEAVTEAAAAGVVGMVCVGTDAATSRQAVGLAADIRDRAARGQGVPEGFGAWATVGLHPHDASKGLEEVHGVLDKAMAAPGRVVVAVGECGLDYHYDHSPRPAQREMFAAQLALARRHELTLVVHSRDAWDDTFAILDSPDRPERVVIHCFTGGPEEARRCLDLGAYISFSGIVTFKNADEVRAAAAFCPLDRLLVETDAPFLAPAPHRGKENRPAYVPLVGSAVAAVRDMPIGALAETTRRATQHAFALV